MKKNLFYPIYGGAFLAILLAGALTHVLLRDEAYSKTEKRALAAAPEFSLQTLADGSFMSHTEDYLQDQFPLRSAFMSLRMNALQTIGVRESQGVYLCTDGSLAEPFAGYEPERMETTAEAIASFVSAHDFENAYVLLVPTASEIRGNVLPPHAENQSERAYFDAFSALLPDSITVFDVFQTLSDRNAKSGDAFYVSDHHWTTEAAYDVFCSLSEQTEWVTGEWTFRTVTNAFSGSLAAKSGFTPASLDVIQIGVNRNADLYTLVDHGKDGGVSGSFYDFDALREGMDPYAVFLGGNDPEITVRTTADTERTLLVFKDSYANCFLPFLAESYKEITIIDPRYYSESVETLFLQKRFTDVLFLYNIQTFAGDGELSLVITEP